MADGAAPDKQIVIQFLAQADKATEDAKKFREEIDKVKTAALKMSSEQKVALKDLEKAWISLVNTQKRTALKETKGIGTAEQQKPQIEAIKAHYAALVSTIKAAFSEAKAEEQKYFASQAALGKQEVTQTQIAEQQKSAAIREGTQNKLRNIQQQVAIQKELDKANKDNVSSTSELSKSFGNLGDISKYVFGTILGVSAIQILRNIIEWFKQATKSGYEFAKAMFSLEVGIRAIRRTGVEITIRDMYENIDRLGKRFGIFSQKELIEGSAQLINLTRDFGFAKEEIFSLQEAISTLAVVNGRAMDEVQRTVALAISSGYTEGLQRLGVSINRVTIANKAAELGFADSYMALTEQQRALATYILILEKTSKYQDDLIKYQETAPGKIDTLRATWTDFTAFVGTSLLPALGDISEALSDNIKKLLEYYDAIKKAKEGGIPENVEELPPQIQAQVAAATLPEQPEEFFNIEQYPAYVRKTIEKIKEEAKKADLQLFEEEEVNKQEAQMNKIESAISENLEDIEEIEQKSQDKRREYQDDFDRDIEKMIRESTRRNEELIRDHQRDVADIERDGFDDRQELWGDYISKIDDIERNLGRDIAEENAKYALNVAQTIRQFTIRKAELEARYRENEKKAEIRFQEEMRRLREGFLFDLEDALHERDARQILRLIRQYNLQKNQAQRQYDIEKDERARAFKLELNELEAQKAERLRILAEEHAARIASLQAQAAYERELAWKKHQQELADLDKQLEEKKAERDRKLSEDQADLEARLLADKEERGILLDQQITDLEAERDRLLTEIGEKLWGALQETTDTGLKNLYDALVATLGKDGDAEKVFQAYATAANVAARDVEGSLLRVLSIMGAINSMANSLGNMKLPNLSGSGWMGMPPTGGSSSTANAGYSGGLGEEYKQAGGPVYRGEVYKVHKDETFVPAVDGTILSKQQSQEALVGALGRNARMGSGNGHATIEVMLQSGLIAKIVDDALDQTAEVLISQMRKN